MPPSLAASAVVLDCPPAALRREVGGAEGIVNGMDVTEWSPKTDKYLPVKYDRNTVFEGKAAAKAALQAEMGLPVDPTAPLFGYIGRLEEQKGVDILLAVSGVLSWASLPPLLVAPHAASSLAVLPVLCWGLVCLSISNPRSLA